MLKNEKISSKINKEWFFFPFVFNSLRAKLSPNYQKGNAEILQSECTVSSISEKLEWMAVKIKVKDEDIN